MDNLSSLEFKQLEALLSGKTLTTGEQIKALTILRDNFPDFLSSPILNLTEANRKDNIFLIKFFRDSFNRNKIKAAARQIISKSLSTVQKQELEKSLVSPVTPTETSEPTAEQSGATEATPVEQVPPPRATTDTAGGEIPGMGIPSPTISVAPRIRDIHEVPQTTPPSGMEGGTGQGSAAFSKGGRLDTQRVGAATAKGNILEMQTAIQKEMQTVQSASQKPAEAFETRPSGLKFNPSAFKARIGNIFKKIQDFAARANPFLKTNLNRIFQGFKSFGGSLLGGLGGFSRGITGPGLTHTANFLGNTGLRGVNAGANFFGGTRNQFLRFREASNRAASLTKSVKNRKWLLLLGLLGFMILTGILAINGANQTGTTGGTIGGSTAGDIASCTFYRGGDKTPGMKLGNPAMATLISDIASKVGVPASITTGIMRVEAPDAFASTNPTYLTNDYEAKSSGVAFGLMQFTVGTFVSTYANNWDSMSKLFNKTSQTTTIDPQDKMQPDTVLRIYSIKDSLIAASYKVKGDKQAVNGEGPWDESTVKQVAAKYYGTNADGTTNYDGWDGSTQNYGSDLWKSYNSCQTTGSLPAIKPGDYCGKGGGASGSLEGPFEIGKTAGGNPINAWKIGNGSTRVAIVGGMNGKQEQSGINIVEAAKNSFGTGNTFTIPANLTVYFVPAITPDSTDGFNLNGQDINRNFTSTSVPGGDWKPIGCSVGRYQSAKDSYLTSCQDNSPHTDGTNIYRTPLLFQTYCTTIAPGAPSSTNTFTCAPNKTGSSTFSEPETQAIANFIQQNSIKTVISYRAPYNNVTSSNSPRGSKLAGVDNLANLFARELGISYDEYFQNYPVNGQFMDWLQDIGVVGVEIELPLVSLSDSTKTLNLQTLQKALYYLSSQTAANTALRSFQANSSPSNVLSATTADIPDDQLIASIKSQFGIEMSNFSTQELRWALDKLSDVSGTNFTKLIKDYNNCNISSTNPIVITKAGQCTQDSCNKITFCNIGNETNFKVVLIHELGHIVYHYTGAKAMQTEHANLYNLPSGTKHSVTTYGATDITENYPEMLTYYLNPGVSEQTHRNYTNSTIIPYNKPENDDFKRLANKILCGGN